MAGALSKFLSRILARILGGPVSGRGAGGTPAEPAAPEEYNGYTIRPAPFEDRGQWITSGVIEKRIDDEVKQHRFIRADMYPGRESAAEASVFKAKQLIDMMGDDVFALEGD